MWKKKCEKKKEEINFIFWSILFFIELEMSTQQLIGKKNFGKPIGRTILCFLLWKSNIIGSGGKKEKKKKLRYHNW